MLLIAGSMASGELRAGERLIPVGPQRVWEAVLGSAAGTDALDAQRFEARLRLAGDETLQVSVDWDEHGGGSRLAWEAPDADPGALAAWLRQVADTAAARPHRNRYCRGLVPDPSHEALPEPSVDAATHCGIGTGNFSSALLELEKCGDHETTLKLLAACSREDHAGGLLRIAQLYETGAGLPRRPERAAHFLARAAAATSTEYHVLGKTLYATALYFGVGVSSDRPRALALFRSAAELGDADARTFLRSGTHAAWRREDGSLFHDPDYRAGEQP